MTNNRPKKNLRLSPNELDNLVREEKKKWQIFRLQQVREQARLEAQRVRRAVVKEQQQIEHDIEEELLEKYLEDRNIREKKLQQEYIKCLEAFGEAHKGAKSQPDPSKVLAERAQYNNIKANRRGKDAAKAETDERNHRDYEKNRPVRQRQEALQHEKIRAQRVAHMPTPEAFKKKKPVVEEKAPKVKLYEAGTYTTTTYVPKSTLVEKEIKSTQLSARQMAKKEEEELATKADTELKESEEMDQKTEQRGREALERERLNRRYIDLMEKLQKAQQDHQLSSYLRGADLTIYEVERSRIGGLTSLEKHMERAVEKMLKEEAMAGRDVELSTRQTMESSDLIEVAESSKFDVSCESRLQDLQEILQKIRQQRQQLLDVTSVSSSEDLPVEEHSKPDETVMDGEHTTNISGRERIQIPSHFRTNAVDESHKDTYPHQHMANKDVFSPVTLPSSIRPDFPSDLKGTGPLEKTFQSPFEESSSLESSSGDIEVKIKISDDSSFETDRPTLPVISNLTRRYQNRSSSIGERTSTEYLSPPSHLPKQDYSHKETLENLRKITEHRQRIASLLDKHPPSSHQRPSHFNTSTKMYTKEMKGEGSGMRPLKKKEKFELKKKEIIQHYINELLRMKGEDLLQISASTVEGSGITISSMTAFLDALEKSEDESTLSTSYMSFKPHSPSLPQSSSSVTFEDIDEVPVRLSSCSSQEKAKHQEYSPATYSSHNSKISSEHQDVPFSYLCSSTKTFQKVASDQDYNYSDSRWHPRTSSLNHRTNQDLLSVSAAETKTLEKESYSSIKPDKKSAVDEPTSETSKTDDTSIDIELLNGQQARNYEKELEILEQLGRLQKLKQDILRAQTEIVIDEKKLLGNPEVQQRIEQRNVSLPSDQKSSRKVTFGEMQLKKELSTILEDSVDASSHINKSMSLSYQTPSREYESSLEEYPRGEILRNTHIKEFNHLQNRSDSSYMEYTVPTSMQRFGIVSQDSSSSTQLLGSNTYPYGTQEMNERGFIGSTSRFTQPKEKNAKLRPDETSEQKNARFDNTAGSSVFTSLCPEDTATSVSTFLNSVDNSGTQIEKHSGHTSHSSESTINEISGDLQAKSLSHKSSSESVTSIPDMTEILKKFGLDWAESMMKKMEKSEKRSSSENSYHA